MKPRTTGEPTMAEPAPRWPEPKRGQTASIPPDLFDAWDTAKHRAAVWADAAAEYEREIRDLIGPATVILADGKPVLYRRITRHQNVTWTQDSLVRANRKAADDELRRITPR